MTMTLPEQIEAMASQSAPHIEKFALSKPMLQAIVRAFQELQAKLDAALRRRHVCESCGELTAYEVPGERTDAPGYAMMERAAIDRMHDMAAATRGVL